MFVGMILEEELWVVVLELRGYIVRRGDNRDHYTAVRESEIAE